MSAGGYFPPDYFGGMTPGLPAPAPAPPDGPEPVRLISIAVAAFDAINLVTAHPRPTDHVAPPSRPTAAIPRETDR